MPSCENVIKKIVIFVINIKIAVPPMYGVRGKSGS
jgi:hypothetical protein